MAWTPISTGLDTVSDLVYGGGVFVVQGDDSGGLRSYARSTDGGQTWGALTAFPADASSGVYFAGGQFFQPRFDTGAAQWRLYTSADGDTWTLCTGVDTEVYAVAFNGSIYVAVVDDVLAHASYTSADGLTWTKHLLVVGSAPYFYQGEIAVAGSLFVSVDSSARTATSADGVAWTEGPLLDANSIFSAYSVGADAVFLGRASAGYGLVMRSANGTDWTYSAAPDTWVGSAAAGLILDGVYAFFGSFYDFDLDEVFYRFTQSSDLTTWETGDGAPCNAQTSAASATEVLLGRENIDGTLNRSLLPLSGSGPVDPGYFWTGMVNTYELP